VIINQVFGGGNKTDGAVSNSFVELYNPTDSDVSLAGWSLQYAASGSSWSVLGLTGTIPADSFYLVEATQYPNPNARYVIPATGIGSPDATWDTYFDNQSVKVALMANQAPLTTLGP